MEKRQICTDVDIRIEPRGRDAYRRFPEARAAATLVVRLVRLARRPSVDSAGHRAFIGSLSTMMADRRGRRVASQPSAEAEPGTTEVVLVFLTSRTSPAG